MIEQETRQLVDHTNLVSAYTRLITSEIQSSNDNYIPFMTTVRFRKIDLSLSSNYKKYYFFSDATWIQYSKTYRFILSQIDRHYNQRPHLNPKTYDFFDVDGTSKNINSPFTENTIPHIHSIYLIHKRTFPAFRHLIDTQFYNVINHHTMCDYIRTIHSKPITHDLEGTVRYCSKFYDNCYAKNMRSDYDLFRQFPITSEEKASLAIERENLPFQVVPKMVKKSNDYMRQRFYHS